MHIALCNIKVTQRGKESRKRKKSLLRNPVSIKGETKKKEGEEKRRERMEKHFVVPVVLPPCYFFPYFPHFPLSIFLRACCPDFALLHLVSRNTRYKA